MRREWYNSLYPMVETIKMAVMECVVDLVSWDFMDGGVMFSHSWLFDDQVLGQRGSSRTQM